MKKHARALAIICVTLLDDIVLIVIALFILRRVGIDLPSGAFIGLVVILVAGSFGLYKLIVPVLNKKQVVGPEALIGAPGKVITPLNPKGYIKVDGELWEALSTDSTPSPGEQVVVVKREGLTLVVRDRNSWGGKIA